jgi:hypothetical protein
MFAAKSENEEEIAYWAYRSLTEKFEDLRLKYEADTEALEKTKGIARTFRKLFHDPKSSKKKAKEIKKKMEKLDAGDFGGINFLVLPGYAFLKLFGVTADNSMFSKVIDIFAELSGREDAVQNTQ